MMAMIIVPDVAWKIGCGKIRVFGLSIISARSHLTHLD